MENCFLRRAHTIVYHCAYIIYAESCPILDTLACMLYTISFLMFKNYHEISIIVSMVDVQLMP